MYVFPPDVANYLRTVFADANGHVSAFLSQVPNAHEPTLDTALISHIAANARPVRLPSNWVVKIDTHFLGSSRYWGRWEIADIGILAMFRRGGELLRTKVALLQSKRLYPNEQKGNDLPNYVGFGALREEDQAFVAATAERRFSFSHKSRYRALQIDDEQYTAILDYETVSDIPIYYMFYNPVAMPFLVRLPADGSPVDPSQVKCGCRIIPCHDFRTAVAPHVNGLTPSFGDLCKHSTGDFRLEAHKGGWRFEEFIVERLLGCRTGYRVDGKRDATLANLFGGRTAPIYAAVSVNIDVPLDVDVQEL